MIFCKHEYKMISETVTKSKLELTLEVMLTANKIPWQLADADRKHIQIFSCSKCGKLKRFVENI